MTASSLPQEHASGGILGAVRRGFETVARMARHVSIRRDRVAEYALSLPGQRPAETYDLDHHFIGNAEDTASYVLAVECVNFGSGYQPALLDEGWSLIDGSQYFTVAQKLKNLYETRAPMTPADFSAMTTDSCRAVFALPDAPQSAELAGLFALSLRQVGDIVTERYGGSFLNFVRAANGSKERFIRQLMDTPSFNDVQTYRGLDIPFLKRAQLAAVVMHIEFERLGQVAFTDAGQTTIFADNGVPHVLHTDGILEYDPALAARIRAGEEIPAGSEEEVEIRACAGHAAELIAACKSMPAADLDFILWHRSVSDERYRAFPTHRTRSRFY